MESDKLEPLISIIIPVYNVEKYVEKCIISVINQTYKNLEIIIVNDGTKDSSGEICERLAKIDNRITYIVQENKGLSGARNTALDKASGEYYFLVDSDDYLVEDAIEQLYKEAIRNNADIVCSSAEMFFADGRDSEYPLGMEYLVLNKSEALYHCMFNNTVSGVPWGKLYKAKLFDNLRYPEGRRCEDEYRTYQLVERADKVICTGKPYYMHLQNFSGLVQGGEVEKYMDYFDAWWERYNFLKSKGYIDYANKMIDMIVRTAYEKKMVIRKSTNAGEICKILQNVKAEIIKIKSFFYLSKIKMIIKIDIINKYL